RAATCSLSLHDALPISQMAVAGLTGGRGADVVIEAVGSEPAFETAVEVVRRGGTVTVVGMYVSETVPMQLGVYWTRALDIRFAGDRKSTRLNSSHLGIS